MLQPRARPTAIATATKCLREIEAIKRIKRDDDKDADFYLTPLGIHLSNLPVDARIGKVCIVSGSWTVAGQGGGD